MDLGKLTKMEQDKVAHYTGSLDQRALFIYPPDIMSNALLRFRYYLEMIAVPVFLWLVIHMSGHGAILLGEHHGHAHAHSHEEALIELVIGVVMALVFIWIWHRPKFKKWVPCSHDHCHDELPVPHILATAALCLHFFPESVIRGQLIEGAMEGQALQLVALIGFIAHFLIDVIVAIVLSSHWPTKSGFYWSLLVIAGAWTLAFYSAPDLMANTPAKMEGVLLLVGAFLLSMFIHKPHKPKECAKCDH